MDARLMTLCGALLLAPRPSLASVQRAALGDSTLTVSGVLEALDAPDQVMLVLETPLALRDGERAFSLMLAGNVRKLRASDGHYVQVRGRLEYTGGGSLPSMRVERLRDVDPPGAVRRTITKTFNEWIVAALVVVPAPVAWRDSTGRLVAITPVALFTLKNLGKVELVVTLPERDLVCGTVTPVGQGTPVWRYAWTATDASARLTVRIGATFRGIVPLPEEAAPALGRYTVRVTLCGLDEYAVEAPLVVQ